MRREIPQKVDAQFGFTDQSRSESVARVGATLFRRTRSASVLSVTLTASVLGILMPHHKATAYTALSSTPSGSVTALPESSNLAISLGSSTALSTESSQDSGSTLINPLASSQSTTLDLQTINQSPAVLGFSTTPNILSATQQTGQGDVQREGFSSALMDSTGSVNLTPSFTLADSSLTTTSIPAPSAPIMAAGSGNGPQLATHVERSAATDTVLLVHRVEKGENLSEIGNKYRVSPDSIAQTNRLHNPNVIDVNESLVIPATTLSATTTIPLIVDSLANDARIAVQSAKQLGVSATLLTPQSFPANIRLKQSGLRPNDRKTTHSAPISDVGQSTNPVSLGAVELPSTPTTGEIYQDAPSAMVQPIAMLPNKVHQAKGASGNGMLTAAITRRTAFPPSLTLDLPPLAAAEQFLPSMTGVNGLQQYIWPAKGVFTSGYGWRWGRMHRGIDIAAPIGTPIVASASGVVISAGWNDGGYGNLVEIRHPDGSETRYAHNNSITTRVGAVVNQGELIAYMGTTGRSTGPHCHFEIRPAGRGAVDPMFFLSRS